MPSTLFSSAGRAHRSLVMGVLALFIVIFGISYWFYHRSGIKEVVQTVEDQLPPPTASTPAEVKSQYVEAVAKAKITATDPAVSLEQKTKILNDFFFSTRVPSELRDAHLAALLAFKSATTAEKITAVMTDLETKIKAAP